MALWQSGRLHGLHSMVGRPAQVDPLWANAPISTIFTIFTTFTTPWEVVKMADTSPGT